MVYLDLKRDGNAKTCTCIAYKNRIDHLNQQAKFRNRRTSTTTTPRVKRFFVLNDELKMSYQYTQSVKRLISYNRESKENGKVQEVSAP